MSDPAEDPTPRQRRGRARVAAPWLALAFLWAGPAAALDAVTVSPEADRIALAGAVEHYETAGDRLTLGSGDGDTVLEVRATSGNDDPGWFGFALANGGDEAIVRWLVVESTGSADSGLFLPALSGPRIVSLRAPEGTSPPHLESGRLDIFELDLPPGAVVTYVAETAGTAPAELTLWDPTAYRATRRALAFFDGLVVGIVGLLAIFLTSLYVVRRRLMFPAAAGVGWAALAVLASEFGLWETALGAGAHMSAMLRVAAEALFAGAAGFLVLAFLELPARERRLDHAIPALAGLAGFTILLATVFPGVAGMVARLSTLAIAAAGAAIVGYFVVRRSRRAVSLAPAWAVFAVFTLLALAIYGGAFGDLARPLYSAGLALVVMIMAFTVMQYAFDGDVAQDPGSRELGLKAIAFTASNIILWDWNVRDETISVGRELDAALGVARGALSGEQDHWLNQVHQLDRDRFVRIANAAVSSQDGAIDTELRLRTSAGGQRWYRLRARAVAREDKQAARFVGSLEDITATRNSHDRLLRDAVHDALTGLPNRALFLDRLARAINRVESHNGRAPSVVVIDIDRFKNVNEGFGHAVGDSILAVIAQRMSAMMDRQDTLARIQGDQFAAVIASTDDLPAVEALAGDLRQVLRQPIYVGEQEVFLTGSLGIAAYERARHETADDLVREAELAMIHAKTAGFDQVATFEPSMQAARSDRLSLESDLRRAIERQEIELLYQPIVGLEEERVAGFEALMRWHHPEQGELAPDDFIDIAEESGLIVELGHFALDTATRQLAIWHRTFSDAPDLFVSVNVSSRQIFRQDLMRDVRLAMTRSNIPAGSLRLEITESLVMENPELAAYVLERLGSMGASLSLDDFGTGYSALSYLQRLPFDAVKVDKSLVTGGQDNAPVIVKSIVNMAHDLGMHVVAEGVEGEDDVAYLKGIGCEYGQGYHFAPPLDATEATKYLSEWR